MSLKGTKTEENLKAAFAGESQANRRYLYFAQKADIEGYNDVATVFRSTAEGETGHAHGHLDYLKEVNDFGASRLIYTDINRDGMKQSPNFEETSKVADISNCPVIISGGVSSIEDVKKAKDFNNKNIEGIIVGKAIYDGDVKLEELVKELNA